MVAKRFDQKGLKEILGASDQILILDYDELIGGFPDVKRILASSIGGSSTSEAKRRVVVNSELSENIEGIAYSTLSDAITFINTQTPSLDDAFIIKLEGDYSPATTENVTLPLGVTICGEGQNRLGRVHFDFEKVSMVDDLTKAFMYGFKNLYFNATIEPTFDPEYYNVCGFFNCEYNGTILNTYEMGTQTTIIAMQGCMISGGNFDKLGQVRLANCNIAPFRANINLSQSFISNSSIVANDSMDYGFYTNSMISKNCFIQALQPISGFDKCIAGDIALTNCSVESNGDMFRPTNLISTNSSLIRFAEMGSSTLVLDAATEQYFIKGGTSDFTTITLGLDNVEGNVDLRVENVSVATPLVVTRTGTDGDFYVTIIGMHNATLTGTMDASRVHCLWDDATSGDGNNWYSAGKINSLIP